MPTQRGTASGQVTATSPLNLSYPAGIQAGDVIVATIQQRGGSSASITPPGGWTSKLRTNSGTSTAEETFYKIATGAESGTAAFTLTGQVNAVGQISAWSSVDTTGDPTDGAAGQSGTSTTAITAPTITTTVAADTLIYGGGGRAGASGNTYTPDATMTELVDLDAGIGSGSVSSQLAVQTLGAAGATGAKTSTASLTLSAYAAQLIALKSVAAPSGGLMKYWTGSGWIEKPVKYWTGSAWVAKPVKYWNGSAWVLS